MSSHSILRDAEYASVAKVSLSGKILDVGGSKKSGYHNLIQGEHEFYVINIDESCLPDKIVDIEKPFPFEDASFDHAVCLNVLEHVFEFEHVFSEQLRCIKKGGTIVIATPFMFNIHGSPDDFLRYTPSTYRRLAEKYGCTLERIDALGEGFFSQLFQMIGGKIPTNVLCQLCKRTALGLDRFFNRMSGGYRNLSARIPLGFFVVFKK